MSLELGPELEVLVKNCQGLLVVLGQADFLPELLGEVRSLNCFHVEVAVALVLQDGRVAGIRKGTGVARA